MKKRLKDCSIPLAILLALVLYGLLLGIDVSKRNRSHKYQLGQKVQLKTGDVGIISSYWYNQYYVRISYTQRVDVDIFGTHHTDIGRFCVEEWEIEKALD